MSPVKVATLIVSLLICMTVIGAPQVLAQGFVPEELLVHYNPRTPRVVVDEVNRDRGAAVIRTFPRAPNLRQIRTPLNVHLDGAIGYNRPNENMDYVDKALNASGASRFSFLPVFQSDASEFLGLSLVNTSAVVDDVAVTWTNSDGSIARTGHLPLAPGAQRALLVKEILNMPEDPTEGWIQIESPQASVLGYLTSGKDAILDGTEPASQLATTIFFAHVGVNTGFAELEHTDTFVTLINPGSVVASARAQLIGLDGLIVDNLAVSIPARASRTVLVSESFRDVLPANSYGGRTFKGYMKVSSDVALAGWLRIDTPLSRRLLRGRAVEEIVAARIAMVSHFASGGASLYHSVLNLINAGDAAVVLEISAQDNRGGKIGESIRLTLGPGQGIREDVLNLFRVVVAAVYPPQMITGYIRIRAADGSMFRSVGDIDITTAGNAASMLYPITAVPSSDWIMPFVINGEDYFTGYAIANPNELLTVQTDVTIEVLDRDGSVAGSPLKLSLSPSARFVGMVKELLQSGYLRIHANGPVILLGSIGTCSGNTLAPLPAIPR